MIGYSFSYLCSTGLFALEIHNRGQTRFTQLIQPETQCMHGGFGSFLTDSLTRLGFDLITPSDLPT
jgi:hypothetical protein